MYVSEIKIRSESFTLSSVRQLVSDKILSQEKKEIHSSQNHTLSKGTDE